MLNARGVIRRKAGRGVGGVDRARGLLAACAGAALLWLGACQSTRVEDPQAFLAEWADDDADLATLSERYIALLDDSTEAAAAYKRMSRSMTEAARPLLAALKERFGSSEEYRALVRELSGGTIGDNLQLRSSTAQRMEFESDDGMRMVFLRDSEGWRIDALQANFDEEELAEAERLLIEQAKNFDERLGIYRRQLLELAEQVRAGHFASLRAVAREISKRISGRRSS